MGAIRIRFSKETDFPVRKMSAACARRTEAAPTAGPRNPPAMGPKNWNKVKNWFSAPVSFEKLMFIPMSDNAANSTRNVTPFGVRTLLLFTYVPSMKIFMKILRAVSSSPGWTVKREAWSRLWGARRRGALQGLAGPPPPPLFNTGRWTVPISRSAAPKARFTLWPLAVNTRPSRAKAA